MARSTDEFLAALDDALNRLEAQVQELEHTTRSLRSVTDEQGEEREETHGQDH